MLSLRQKAISDEYCDGGHDPVLITRKPERLSAEQARGATVAHGDLSDRAFVTEVVAATDALSFVCPPTLRTNDHREYRRKIA